MADENLLARVHSLSDLELAVLVSLVARGHCIISTTDDAVDELVEELLLVRKQRPPGFAEPVRLIMPQISSRTFGLSGVVANCHAHTTLEAFAASLLVPGVPPSTPAPRSASPSWEPPRAATDYFPPQSAPSSSRLRLPRSPQPGAASSGSSGPAAAQQRIANVVLAKHLDRAPKAVQIQALELLRSRRIFTRTAVQAAPKPFLFVAVLGESGGAAPLTPHLNDFFHLSHWHDPEDGFANLDDDDDDDDDDETASTASVVKRRERAGAADGQGGDGPAVVSEADIASLERASASVRVDVDAVRYQMNIISFLRMHRAVASGITSVATKHFEHLVRCLAPLHRLDYVTPSLVALAARKVYQHRIRIVAPERERSMQWGSEPAAIRALLDGVEPGDVIEDVLGMVAAPL